MSKICFAIPTWNRAEKLEKCIDSIARQIIECKENATIFVSDNCSDDATPEVLRRLSQKYDFLEFHRREEHGGVFENLSEVSRKAEGEYIWWFGDDDVLLPEGLNTVIARTADEDVAVISAGNGWFSPHSGKILQGTVLELCNQFGWNQLVGWMSADVLRKDVARTVGDLILREPFSLDAYAHVGAILCAAAEQKAMFIDIPIAQPIERQNAQDMERWAKENIAWRYFLLIKTLFHLFDKGVLNKLFRPEFFKYLNYYLWDRFIVNMISSGISKNEFPDEGWDIILLMAEMIDDADVKKNIIVRCGSARMVSETRKSLLVQVAMIEKTLIDVIRESSKPVLSISPML